LTSEHSTLCHHVAALHTQHYRKWCNANNFDSMLPQDSKQRKCVDKEPSITEHFGPEDPSARPIPFSNKALETAALEWLIEKNQLIQTFDNAMFKKMLNIASQAPQNTNIQLPSSRQSRPRIIKMFKQQLRSLRDRLNVFFFCFFFSMLSANILSCSFIRAPL
ncbi:hypothetical protein EDB83DRAFT_2229764, partial [Lactarius deliciosus]